MDAKNIEVGSLWSWGDTDKTWKVTRVYKTEGVVDIENVDRPQNTAQLPVTQFSELSAARS